MNTLGLGLSIAIAGGFAYVTSVIVQNIISVYKEIKEEEVSDVVITKLYIQEDDLWFNPGDTVEYKDTTGFIVGPGLDNTVTIMLEDGSILDVPAGKIRKVVTL